MLSINTNISSLVAQNSLNKSTTKLNQAIERMTTGYKINSAKDNAANFSISTNMATQLNSYDIASSNVSMGMDLIRTADDILSTMQDKAARLQALCTQAQNDTNGAQSLLALNTEAQAILAEINRIYNTAEYNGVNLFSRKAYDIAEHLPQAGESGFIDETNLTTAPEAKAEYNGFIEDPKTYTDAEVAAMARVKDVSTFTSGQKYAIYTKDELVKLADYVNSGKDTTNVEFVLGRDIDLSSIENWTPIGNGSSWNTRFKGTFDGNGHVIRNITINSSSNLKGLFASTTNNAIVKNIGIENGNISGTSSVGLLVGSATGSDITNCYAKGNSSGTGSVGLLVGSLSANMTNCYAIGTVEGTDSYVGGLVGDAYCDISNCYVNVKVSGKGNIGGLVGYTTETIENSYATGNVIATSSNAGGLVGYANYANVTNSYATGNVVSTASSAGGLVGYTTGTIENSYATGNVSGKGTTGGLIGSADAKVINSYATGIVTGTSYDVGGLIGKTTNKVSSCYATGDVNNSGSSTGGLVGYATNTNSIIENSYAMGNVSGLNLIGGLVGRTITNINGSYATGNVNGEKYVGGLVGRINKTSGTVNYDNDYYYGFVNGTESDSTGSFIGGLVSTTNGTTFATVNITNSHSVSQNLEIIGGVFQDASSTYTKLTDYDMSTLLAGIEEILLRDTSTTLQVGISGNSSSQINFDTNFSFDLKILKKGIETDEAKEAIFEFINLLSEKATKIGAIENRLDSALDSIAVTTENLTSSLSTIRDADISEVTSEYIKQQILQQASDTLLATANQNPSIALQLI